MDTDRLLAQACIALRDYALSVYGEVNVPNVDLLIKAAAALAARVDPKVGEWKVLPSTPTQEMIERGVRGATWMGNPEASQRECARIYAAMLAAAPPPPSIKEASKVMEFPPRKLHDDLMASAKREQQVEAFQAELAKLSARVTSLEAAPPLTVIGGTVVHPVLTEDLNNRLARIEERIERLEPKPGSIHLMSSKDLR